MASQVRNQGIHFTLASCFCLPVRKVEIKVSASTESKSGPLCITVTDSDMSVEWYIHRHRQIVLCMQEEYP